MKLVIIECMSFKAHPYTQLRYIKHISRTCNKRLLSLQLWWIYRGWECSQHSLLCSLFSSIFPLQIIDLFGIKTDSINQRKYKNYQIYQIINISINIIINIIILIISNQNRCLSESYLKCQQIIIDECKCPLFD